MAARIPQPTDHPEPTGRIQGELVVADGLTTAAPDFVTRAVELADAADIGQLCQTAFDIGVTALRTVQVDSELRRASDVMDRLETSIEDATTRAIESVHTEMDTIARPEGGLIADAVTREMAKLSEALDAAFAQDDRNSVLSRVEQVITTAAGQVVTDALSKMQRLVDPSADESPMGRLVREITQGIRPGLEAVTGSVNELREFLKVTAAVAKEREKGHEKGRSYQDLVGDALALISVATGDVLERVADDAGADGGAKVGDHVIVVDRPTGPVRIVFEAKDVASMSSRRAREELDEAAENRQASVAVMVFAGQTNAIGEMPLAKLAAGRHAVVFDKATQDDLALRVAYQLARHEALAMPGAGSAIDLQELGSRVTQAHRILDQITEVKRGHGQIDTGLKTAREHLERLQQDLGAALDGIVDYIGRSEAGAEPGETPE
jgi:hypothetical protein